MNEVYQYQSSLLIDEPPMLMLPSLAKALKSADKAIMVQQIHYWLQIKRKANDARAFHDGRWWVFNSIQQWHDQFIWMSERTIRRNLDELSKMGIIIVSRFNNKAFDRTKWYTLDYDLLDQLAQGPKKPQADAFSDSGQSNRPTWPQQPSNMAPTSVQVDPNNRSGWPQQPARVTKPIPENTSKTTSKTISKTSSSSSAYSVNGEYIHSGTTASSLTADDDGRTQSGQSMTQSAPTASPAVQPQRPQRQYQPNGWTEPADPTGPDSLADPNGMNQIFRIWADLWSCPSSTTIADLTAWAKEFGPEVVLYAIKKAATADASRPHAYMAAIIRGYRNAGIKTLDAVKAADQAREQRSQQKQSYGRPQYNNNRGNRANVQEAKQDDDEEAKPKTAEQLDGERLERDLHRAVMLQQQLYGVDLTAICHNLDQPDGHGFLSAKAPQLFEQYCAQNHLDVSEQIKKARETADFS
ncbi:DnaD domain protein [Limosilactobacillus mucosae]|uniref:DnaD domain protein n=1 Tax=Limosilactobacillus mucosae TaxID=97478 RepID=UPI0022E4CF84|nr:DnaD domain protein [Limosilactobacillus mucosae]